jgi:hypothetical protein
MYRLELTEEEIAIMLQALSHYQYNNPHISEEQWDIANQVVEKIDSVI